MQNRLLHILLILTSAIFLAGCNDEPVVDSEPGMRPDGSIILSVGIDDYLGTRGILDESKRAFESGELLHIEASFDIGEAEPEKYYGLYKYKGHNIWDPNDAAHTLFWPDEAKSGTFKAYYIAGSNGVLSDNPMPEKLFSDYTYETVPLCGIAEKVTYGQAVKLNMKHMFSYLTLTEMREGIADELWFTVPPETDGSVSLNNAFRLKYDSETKTITPEFLQQTNDPYKDENGNPLVSIRSHLTNVETDGMVTTSLSFFLEPGVYHQFSVLYPRTRDTYATYLTYTGDLEKVTGENGLLPNGRYVFSILKSLGVIVEQAPETGWDEGDPTIKIDVEKFLRAAASGSNYYETDPETGEEVQILESTIEGCRLLENVDFENTYYDVWGSDNFRASLDKTLDGNYHYIYNVGCPLFYQINGTLLNLGFRNSKNLKPLISAQKFVTESGVTIDNSYNGFVASINHGMVNNIRVDGADMTIQIKTTDDYEPTQEAHFGSLLFGENNGTVYNVGLAGDLRLTVENAPGETIIPRITIGSLTGQNLGSISGVTEIDAKDFESPDIKIFNKCQGDNGVYKVGGLTGINPGRLENITLPSITADCSGSKGLESHIGGLAGDIPSSTSGAPRLERCIVHGNVMAGASAALTNLNSLSRAGGIAGTFNVQADIIECSVSVGITGSPTVNSRVEYAEGGAFGYVLSSVGFEGTISNLACFGPTLSGPGVIGNFAGSVPAGFGWDHYQDKSISVRTIVSDIIGEERQ